ncbi:juvenile hormone acid O-methyltransferase isoform X2 [Linepithema humile]|uniref:juvenile hormone acid O-methyltransferase isoform X2 n=1 Tax=Linepithema humile TaxID=83485 RepID=UPI000623B398|nr:PREDICTED: uncharacterized protein LOC105671800 [Linepithema humile]
MDFVEDYVEASDLQRRDAKDVIDEFCYEIKKMQGNCLDIGCGPGFVTKKLLLPILEHDVQLVGADISETMVSYAQKHNADEKLSYIVLDIEAPELPSDQIERYKNILSFYCLHWCNDLRFALQNVYKLLQSDGKALIAFLGHHGGFDEYVRCKQNPRYQQYLQDAHRYVPYFQRMKISTNYKTSIEISLRKMLQDIGFKILHCSKREKSYRYSKQSLKDHAYAVNPFIHRLPDDIREEFIDHLVNEIISHNGLVPFESTKNEQDMYKNIVLRYYLMIAYVQKLPAAA